MLRLIALSAALCICFALLLTGTLLAVQSRAEPPTIAADLREFTACQFPCWFGIQPDEMPIVRAHRILTEAGYLLDAPADSDGVFYYYRPPAAERCAVQLDVRETIVRRIQLETCPPTRLGDVIRVLGQPMGVLAERNGLAFGDGSVIVFMPPVACRDLYQPEALILSIDFRSADLLSGYLKPWHGFYDGQYYQPHPQAGVHCR